MRITNNTAAFSVFKYYERNTSALRQSMERLASGLKINKAADDAAGLAISEKFRSQIKNTQMAAQNTQNMISYLQTADGWMQNMSDMLNRMSELYIEAYDQTKSNSDRLNLAAEFAHAQKELSNIATAGNYISNGGFETAGAGGADNVFETWYSWRPDLASCSDTTVPAEVYSGSHAAKMTRIASGGSPNMRQIRSVTPGETYTISFYTRGDGTNAGTYMVYDTYNSVAITTPQSTGVSGTTYQKVSFSFTAPQNCYRVSVGFGPSSTVGSSAYFDEVQWTVSSAAKGVYNTQFLFNGSNASVQAGPDSGQTFTHTGLNLGADALGYIGNYSTGSGSTASDALRWANIYSITIFQNFYSLSSVNIKAMEFAIQHLAKQRATVGAELNRLERTKEGLKNYEDNIIRAESIIRDTDIAKESTSFTRRQILVQASAAMLAQANVQPQSVLALLGGG